MHPKHHRTHSKLNNLTELSANMHPHHIPRSNNFDEELRTHLNFSFAHILCQYEVFPLSVVMLVGLIED